MDSAGRLLVVDDDKVLLQLLELNLGAAGYRVTCVDNGAAALRWFYDHRPDLVILDLAMPEMNGWQVCQRIREFSDVPIIMLTAFSEPEYRIRGLTMGADDYLTKPFDVHELSLRVAAILRRVGRAGGLNELPHARYDDGRLCIDLEERIFSYDGRPIKLTPQESSLLACFVRQQGKTLSHAYLLHRVWGSVDATRGESYVKTYVRYLRKKIEPNPKEPIYIVTDHGLGYRLTLPGERTP